MSGDPAVVYPIAAFVISALAVIVYCARRRPNVRGPFIREIPRHASVDCADGARWRCENCQRTLCVHNLRMFYAMQSLGRDLTLCPDCYHDLREDDELRRVGVRDPYYPEHPQRIGPPLHPEEPGITAFGTSTFVATSVRDPEDAAFAAFARSLQHPPQGGSGVPPRRAPEPKPEPSGRRIVL